MLRCSVSNETLCLKYSDDAISHFEINGKHYGWLSPQLHMLAEHYGESNTTKWIEMHLRGIVLMSGVKADEITALQISKLASIILYEHPTMRDTEFMLFCQKFKAGEYGTFYGSVDPMKIGEALKSFRSWAQLRRREVYNKALKESKSGSV